MDDSEAFGDRDEHGRADRSEPRMVPAQQRLGTGQAAVAPIDFRLVVQRQLAAVHRMAQVVLKAERLERTPVHVGFEDREDIAAGLFRGVHRRVGPRDQFIARTVLGEHDDADRGRDLYLPIRDVERRGQRIDQPLSERAALHDAAYVLHQKQEFVAADPRNGVALPRHAEQSPGCLF